MSTKFLSINIFKQNPVFKKQFLNTTTSSSQLRYLIAKKYTPLVVNHFSGCGSLRCQSFSTSSTPQNTVNPSTAESTTTSSTTTNTNTNNTSENTNANTREKKQSKTREYTKLDVIIDGGLGIALGYTLFQAYLFLSDRPEPLSLIIDIANNDPLVQEMLGTPVKIRFISPWTGSVNEHEANVIIPVTGSKAKGTLYARAIMNEKGEWKFLYIQASDDQIPQRHSVQVPQHALFFDLPLTRPQNDAGSFSYV
jgi:hypothetical protein